jgi:hypothetical protein
VTDPLLGTTTRLGSRKRVIFIVPRTTGAPV